MKILVTGAAGFIGARVAGVLIDGGHEVVGADNLCETYDPRMKAWRLDRLQRRAGFSFAHVDVADAVQTEALFSGTGVKRFDAVVNLAARAGIRPSVEIPGEYYRTNLLGTLGLLECCRRHGVGRFVLASSSSVYGNVEEVPFREDARVDGPLSPYAASKRAAEDICHVYGHLHGIRCISLRYFTVFGPAGRPDMAVFRFIQRIREGRPIVIYGDGAQRRDFSFVDDIAAGTVQAALTDVCGAVNLGSDRPVSVAALVAEIEQLTGQRSMVDRRSPHPADARETWADIGRAFRVLGWRPQVAWQEGLARTVTWYEENRDWARDIQSD